MATALKRKICCPTCNGSGEIEAVISKSQTNRPLAKKLAAQGLTVREIAKYLGYKNPGSVSNLLKELKKDGGKK